MRRKTRTVMVGNVAVGSDHPIRIQSMTTSSTRDVQATIDQIKKLADYGCEIARVTVQGMKEAEACEGIKNGLIQSGYTIPLVADIHFYPPAALSVADFVDKVRINPGNFVDKRATFKVIDYDDESYQRELEKIEEKFTPLVLKCKKLKRAMRIGTNHGSLSDRIMNRFGDTPAGMVESALEFLAVCRKHDYHDVIFSMKASNPIVMIEAYRLLSYELDIRGWDYPLHLGVTEAGDGEDGRIKSASGTGTLLLDGLGDTIRVSLTEDPWFEIDPCQRLIALAEQYAQHYGYVQPPSHYNSQRRPLKTPIYPTGLSFHRDGTVALKVDAEDLQQRGNLYESLGCGTTMGRPTLKKDSVDLLWIDPEKLNEQQQSTLDALHETGIKSFGSTDHISNARLYSLEQWQQKKSKKSFRLHDSGSSNEGVLVTGLEEPLWKALTAEKPAFIVLRPPVQGRLWVARRFLEWAAQQTIDCPILLNFNYDCSVEDLTIFAGSEAGALLSDGYGDGLLLEGAYPLELLRRLSFNILQACRRRTIKTDFISCPSCGRTLFDLQSVTAAVKSKTAHLPGVKIAIMGCIVNGPGEMADADFGYVGSKPGMIDLYVGKECVEKNIVFNDAVDRLVELIKSHGRWVEPVMSEE